MAQYRLVLHYGGESPPKSIWIERDELHLADSIRLEGHVWLVVGPHQPADALEPEPNAFDCKLIE